jgi:Mce-associated membrane protein
VSDEDRATESATDDTDVEETVEDSPDLETPDEDAEVAESADEDADEDPPSAKTPRRSGRALVTAAVLAFVLLAASAGLTSWLYVNDYRPDQQTDPAAAQVALDAAKTGTIALLSYSPESLDQDFANAKSKLTGDFLSYYTQFTEQIVTPAAREKSVKTAASVVRAAVSEIAPDSAEVLVFINQTTTSKENPDGAFAASSVKVGLKKIDGNWLIDSFDPV